MQSDELEHVIGSRLTALNQTISTAESCSGGLIAHRITNVPGSSAYFIGGVVSYSNASKEAHLGVPHNILVEQGSVSSPVAQAMAEGAKRAFQTHWAIGVTGIAGPTGGTPQKPVGLVFIAVAGPNRTEVQQFLFNGSRESIKSQTAKSALSMVLEQLE